MKISGEKKLRTESKHGRSETSRYIIAAFLSVLLTNTFLHLGAAHAVVPKSKAKLVSFDSAAFDRARDLIKEKKSLKGRTESSIVEYFQEHPESLKHDIEKIVLELNAQPKVVDTTKHVRLVPPRGRPGFEDLRIYVSHDYSIGEKRVPAEDLVQVLIDSVRLAKKEIAINVYEFNLDELANELIKARKERKISIRVGVDAKPLATRPEQRAIVEKLRAGGVDVTEVDSTKINHQKIIAIDWTDPALARAVFSSGNFTYSCLHPRGDLHALISEAVAGKSVASAEKSIPNANHIITMKSWLAANLINHEITKTFSRDLQLRGRTFPTSGAYQITGPGVDPQTFEAYPQNSFIIAFTPGGGNRDVNKNILSHLLAKSEGPVRMTQFAFSSKDIGAALLNRAERDIQATGKFDFLSVGDTPFAMQHWSQFLKMSGLKRVSEGKGRNKKVTFVEDPQNPWTKRLKAEQLASLRKGVRVAPFSYGNSHVAIGGVRHEVTAKIHHKIMSMGDFAVIGTSFNFSEGAENNNEQVLVFNDPKMAEIVRGITAELASQSPRSVYEEAERRSARATRMTDRPLKLVEAKAAPYKRSAGMPVDHRDVTADADTIETDADSENDVLPADAVL